MAQCSGTQGYEASTPGFRESEGVSASCQHHFCLSLARARKCLGQNGNSGSGRRRRVFAVDDPLQCVAAWRILRRVGTDAERAPESEGRARRDYWFLLGEYGTDEQ